MMTTAEERSRGHVARIAEHGYTVIEGVLDGAQCDALLADLDRAYAISIKLGLVGEQRYALNAIANVYSDENVGEYDKAIAYYRQLLEQDRAAGARLGEATTRYNIASALEKKGAYAMALPEYRQALEIYTAAGDRSSIAETERVAGIHFTNPRQEIPDYAGETIARLRARWATAPMPNRSGVKCATTLPPEPANIDLPNRSTRYAPSRNPLGTANTPPSMPTTARSMLRRAAAKLSTTSVIASPIFMNSRALRGAGSAISRSGTYPFTSLTRTYAPCDE